MKKRGAQDRAIAADIPPFPESLLRPLPPARELPRPLAPSGASSLVVEADDAAIVGGRSPVLDPEAEPAFAIERGTAIHKLLQMLPDIAEEEREAAARRYLGRVAGALAGGRARTGAEFGSGYSPC